MSYIASADSSTNGVFYNQSITKLTLPSTLTKIGDYAFYNCDDVTNSISLGGSNLTTIGKDAFHSCTVSIASLNFRENTNITTVDLSGCTGLTSIGENAFYNCTSLTNITIPSSVTSIGSHAFRYCRGLTDITIPSSVTSIGSYAFYDCEELHSVHITDMDAWCRISFADKYATPFEYAENFYLNNQPVTNVTIPNDLTEIKAYTFFGVNSLNSVTLHNNITRIGESAFGVTNLTSVTIPSSVTSIGTSAFDACYSLVEVYNLSGLNITAGSTSYGYVGYYAKVIHTTESAQTIIQTIDNVKYYVSGNEFVALGLTNRGITTVTFDEQTTKINSYAFFSNTEITNITITSKVTSIGDYAFKGCVNLSIVFNLSRLNITAESTSNGYIGNYATRVLASNHQDKIQIINNVIYYEDDDDFGPIGLVNKDVTSIVLDSRITAIGYEAFKACTSLTSIDLSGCNNLTTIGDSAFSSCDSLTSIDLSGCTGLAIIGDNAFDSCTSLTS